MKRSVPVFLTLLVLALVAQPVAAEPVSDTNIEVEKVTVDEEGGTSTVTVEYETSLSVRLSTFLFGSGPLEERVLDTIGAERQEADFVRLGPESAELVYKGETEEIISMPREYPLVVR